MEIPDEVYAEVFRQRRAELDLSQLTVAGRVAGLTQATVSRLTAENGQRKLAFTDEAIFTLRKALNLIKKADIKRIAEDRQALKEQDDSEEVELRQSDETDPSADTDFDRRVDEALQRYYRRRAIASGASFSAFVDLSELARYASLRVELERYLARPGLVMPPRQLADDIVSAFFPGFPERAKGHVYEIVASVASELGHGDLGAHCLERARSHFFGAMFDTQVRRAEELARTSSAPEGFSPDTLMREVRNLEQLAHLADFGPDITADCFMKLAQWYTAWGTKDTRKGQEMAALAAGFYIEARYRLTKEYLVGRSNPRLLPPDIYTCEKLADNFLSEARANVIRYGTSDTYLDAVIRPYWAAVHWRVHDELVAEHLVEIATLLRRWERPNCAIIAASAALALAKDLHSERALLVAAQAEEFIRSMPPHWVYTNVREMFIDRFEIERRELHYLWHWCVSEVRFWDGFSHDLDKEIEKYAKCGSVLYSLPGDWPRTWWSYLTGVLN